MYAYYVECGSFIRFNCFRLHEFKWHGTDPENKTRMVPGRDKFQQLAVIPEQFYYNVSPSHKIKQKFWGAKFLILSCPSN